jgi:hypothetical protein
MNTKTKQLRRHYDNLEDFERFRALLAAEARGDDSEVKALYRSAPKKTYTMTGYPFAGMHDALLNVGAVAALDMLGHGVLLAFAFGQMMPQAENADQEAQVWRACTDHAEHILAIREALDIFADEVLKAPPAHVAEFLPGGDRLDLVLTTAHEVAGIKERGMRRVLGRLPEEDRAGALEDHEAIRDAQREAAAREYADALRKLWETWIT